MKRTLVAFGVGATLGIAGITLGAINMFECRETVEFALPELDGKKAIIDVDQLDMVRDNDRTVYELPLLEIMGYYVSDVESIGDLLKFPATLDKIKQYSLPEDYSGPVVQLQHKDESVLLPASRGCLLQRK